MRKHLFVFFKSLLKQSTYHYFSLSNSIYLSAFLSAKSFHFNCSLKRRCIFISLLDCLFYCWVSYFSYLFNSVFLKHRVFFESAYLCLFFWNIFRVLCFLILQDISAHCSKKPCACSIYWIARASENGSFFLTCSHHSYDTRKKKVSFNNINFPVIMV